MASAIPAPRARLTAVLVALALGAVLAAVFAAPRADAKSPIYGFEVVPSTAKAGAHPNIHAMVWMGNRFTQHIPAPSCDCQDARDISIEMPTGVVGDPHAAPKCSAADFANLVCAPESQIGSAVISINAEKPGTEGFGVMGVYNLEPHPGEAGLLAFNIPLLKFPIFVSINARTEGDYGLEATVKLCRRRRGRGSPRRRRAARQWRVDPLRPGTCRHRRAATSALAQAAGLDVTDSRIVVGADMQTSVPGIYAAGDVALTFNPSAGRRLAVEHWQDAVDQGAVAGASAAGMPVTWDAVPGFWTTVGDATVSTTRGATVYQRSRLLERENGFTVWYEADGAAVGVLTYNADEDYRLGEGLIRAGERVPVPLDG